MRVVVNGQVIKDPVWLLQFARESVVRCTRWMLDPSLCTARDNDNLPTMTTEKAAKLVANWQDVVRQLEWQVEEK
jgi:hypothetical protein